MTEPEQCKTMSEVRAGVDKLDADLVALLAKRFRYMDAAARIKQRRDQVRDEERKTIVIEQARAHAQMAGAPAGKIAQLYDCLVELSIGYELQAFDRQ